MTINQDMKALEPRAGIDARFLAHYLEAAQEALMPLVDEAGHGTRRLPTERLRTVLCALPPEREQAAIVRFLDYMDRRIRRYIRAKQKLIKLLEEQKQAIIHRAVTRGLDPHVRLKPSGVEWLGDVPEHWRIVRLKVALLRPLRNGLFKRKESYGTGARLVNVADVYREDLQIDPSSLERVQATPEELVSFRVLAGDLFFVRSSLKLEGTGRLAAFLGSESDVVFECHLVQARPRQDVADARFLAFMLTSYAWRHYLISKANVVTMATVAQGVFGSCPVLLPPLSEQRSLLARLERACRPIELAIERARDEMSLLREYRTRLIADVVTGKLDVREIAARLAEETDEPEALDEMSEAEDEGDEGEGASEDRSIQAEAPDGG